MTFEQAKELFRKARDKSKGYRLPGRNGATRLIRYGDDYGIQLYDTIVVMIHKDGTYTLNSGGYRTVTTKERINLYSPFSISQRNHKWYFTYTGIEFMDGIRLGEGGG